MVRSSLLPPNDDAAEFKTIKILVELTEKTNLWGKGHSPPYPLCRYAAVPAILLFLFFSPNVNLRPKCEFIEEKFIIIELLIDCCSAKQ